MSDHGYETRPGIIDASTIGWYGYAERILCIGHGDYDGE